MRAFPRPLLLALMAAIAAACTNAGETLTLPPLALGRIGVGVYFDRDGSLTQTTLDTTVAGVRVALLAPTGQDTLRTATTNASGLAVFDSVPIGSYRLVVDRKALADSVGVVAGDTGVVRLIASNDSIQSNRVIRLGYLEVSLAAARLLPAGQRVLVRGKVVSPLQAFRDSTAFLLDTSGTLRVTDARPRLGGNGNSIGDSVLVLGTTAEQAGQAVLSNGLFLTYGPGVAPLPQVVTVPDAIDARGGALDAALVQLTSVVIRDTASSGPDFILKVADPATPDVTVTVLLDQLLNAPRSIFSPGRTGTFRGVLVPEGDGTWVLKPRIPQDIILN
jgi:hypothetical protein